MKLILDLDTGIDDALALAYVLGKPVDLLGITTVFGNIDVSQAAKNTLGLLDLLKKSSVPVYQGAASALNEKQYQQKRGGKIFHGEDGLANLSIKPKSKKQSADAVAFILESAKIYQEELVIVATGPLTNLAQALIKDSAAMKKVKEIVIMGGALTVPGNVSPYAEANIAQDPQACSELFSSGIPIKMIGLDVTLRTLLTRQDISGWQSSNPKKQAYYQLLDFYLKAHERISPQLGGCALHDPLAVAAALQPDLLSYLPLCLKVDKEQPGRTIVDQKAMNQDLPRNISVAVDVDTQRIKTDFLHTLNNLFEQ